MRQCEICGGSLDGMKASARYCGIICKSRAQRQRIAAARPPKPTREEAFAASHAPEGECWIWQRGCYLTGYGQFRKHYAHRFSYELHVGPIPQGHQIHHTCENRRCVNPDHLRALAPAAHQQQHPNSLASANARKTHCPQGHPYSPENTRPLHGGKGRGCRICHRESERRRKANTNR